MLKISKIESGADACLLRLEGKLVGSWVDELDALCAATTAGNRAITLDLLDLSYADRRGIALLRRLRRAGIRITESSPLLKEELKV